MVKASIKTYWKNMRFLIIVLGILFVALLVGLTLLANGAAESVSAIGKDLGNYITQNSLSFEPIGQAFQGKGNFFEALVGVLSNYAGYAMTFVTSLGIGIVKIIRDLMLFMLVFMIGVLVSRDVVFVLARNKEKRGILDSIFELFTRDILLILYYVLVGYLFYVPFLQVVGIVFACAFPLAFSFLSLLAEWLAAGKDRPAFTSVITIKNILVLLLENVIVLLISAALGVLLTVFFGGLVGYFVGRAILILGEVAVILNGQAYVFGTYEIKTVEKKTEVEAEARPETEAAPVTEAIPEDVNPEITEAAVTENAGTESAAEVEPDKTGSDSEEKITE